MRVSATNLEIRGKEVKTSQKTGNEYIIARVEDDTGKSYEFIDRDMDHFEYYKKGRTADFVLDLEIYGRNWSVSVADFKLKEE